MIPEFIKNFDDNRNVIKRHLKKRIDESEYNSIDYLDIVEEVLMAICDYEPVDSSSNYGIPNYNRITVIDDGDCQGTLLFVIPENCYQPSEYYYVKVGYGSCSGCDTLLWVLECYKYNKEKALEDLMTLALHVFQGLKKLEG